MAEMAVQQKGIVLLLINANSSTIAVVSDSQTRAGRSIKSIFRESNHNSSCILRSLNLLSTLFFFLQILGLILEAFFTRH